MINLTMFSTEEDLIELTGLTHDELLANDFNLDAWDVGFVSDVPLTVTRRNDDDEDGGEYEETVSCADWLVRQMEAYCVGYEHVEFKGRHYYLVVSHLTMVKK